MFLLHRTNTPVADYYAHTLQTHVNSAMPISQDFGFTPTIQTGWQYNPSIQPNEPAGIRFEWKGPPAARNSDWGTYTTLDGRWEVKISHPGGKPRFTVTKSKTKANAAVKGFDNETTGGNTLFVENELRRINRFFGLFLGDEVFGDYGREHPVSETFFGDAVCAYLTVQVNGLKSAKRLRDGQLEAAKRLRETVFVMLAVVERWSSIEGRRFTKIERVG